MPAMDEGGAVFLPTRVGSGRRSRVLAGGVVLAIGAMIAFGALDRLGGEAEPEQQAAPGGQVAVASASTGGDVADAARTTRQPPRSTITTPGITHGRLVEALIAIDPRPAGSFLFVHGDVYSLAVARVTVTLEDGAGHVAATESVNVPAGSTAFWTAAVPRFDVHFALPDEVRADGLLVSATAFDSEGSTLGTVLRWIPRATVSM